MPKKYKNEKLDGLVVTFTFRYGRVWGRIPSITSQFLGDGKTKAEAFDEVKDTYYSYMKRGRR